MAIQFMNPGLNPSSGKLFCFYFLFKIGQNTPSFSFLIMFLYVIYGLFDVCLKGLKICLKEKISVFDKNKNKRTFKGTKNLKIAKMWFLQKLKN
jgi:hypothetical protein